MTIQVRFEEQGQRGNGYPTWETTYYDQDGTVMAQGKQRATSATAGVRALGWMLSEQELG